MQLTRRPLLSNALRESQHFLLGLLLTLPMLSFSNAALAELKPLGTYSLSQVTGQAGLTIDIETELTIGEIEYVDAGSMFWRDFSFTGIGGGKVDNLRATVDFSDGAEILMTGFSDIAFLARHGYMDETETDVAWAISEYEVSPLVFGKQYGDGDALIHVSSTNYGIDFDLSGGPGSGPNPADHANNLNAYKFAVDFHLQTGSIGLQASDNSQETVLSENFSIQAYLGYVDILLTNNGNGFSQTSTGDGRPDDIRLADSYMGIDLKFRVEDLDIDNTNNANPSFIPSYINSPGLTLRDMRIHNERGGDTLGSFGFASFESKIGAAMDILHVMESNGTVEYVDGHSIYDINAKMDWDLPHISFGDTGESIGEVYITDIHIQDTSWTISAHR